AGLGAPAHVTSPLDSVGVLRMILTLLGWSSNEEHPMQHPNIALVQRVYGAYMSGDQDVVAASLAPDVRWHNSGFDATAGDLDGVPAVLDYLMGTNHVEDYSLAGVDSLA